MTTLMTLPTELRLIILEFAAMHALLALPKLPSLLRVNKQLRAELQPIFFSSHSLRMELYYESTASWVEVADWSGKARLSAEAYFWRVLDRSNAAARRFVEGAWMSSCYRERGITTVTTSNGVRTWLWGQEKR